MRRVPGTLAFSSVDGPDVFEAGGPPSLLRLAMHSGTRRLASVKEN
jgi:hypothetical protein